MDFRITTSPADTGTELKHTPTELGSVLRPAHTREDTENGTHTWTSDSEVREERVQQRIRMAEEGPRPGARHLRDLHRDPVSRSLEPQGFGRARHEELQV